MILLIDDVGVDRLHAYDAKFAANTPVIDELATEGVVFQNAWGLSVCSPTRAALQTGKHARRTGFGRNPDILSGVEELDPAFVTLAEMVEHSPTADWASSYVGKWHLSSYDSFSSTLSPVVQGWEWWSGAMANISNYEVWDKVDNDGVEAKTNVYAVTDNVNDALERVGVMEEPWLLQVSFNGAHGPFHVPPAHLHSDPDLTALSSAADLHRAMIEAVDTEIGRLLDGLTDDVRDHTTIFVLGDNGTPSSVLADESPSPERTKGSMFDGGIQIPLIVSGAHVSAPGTSTKTFAHVVDIFPTVADIAGVDTSVLVPDLDGYSLLPTLADPTASTGRTMLYTEKFRPGGGGPFSTDLRVMRHGRFKVIVSVCAQETQFFEYLPGAYDEGVDLLTTGIPLTEAQQAAFDELLIKLEIYTGLLAYEGSTWPAVHAECRPEGPV